MMTLHELTALGVGIVSLTEALGLTTLEGRAFAGFLERIKAGITDAHKRGKAYGRPRAKANDAAQIRTLAQQGFSQAAMAWHLGLWRTSVRRVLVQQEGS
jgi:DNA invertase Pin-like site-specific DNA recombinase